MSRVKLYLFALSVVAAIGRADSPDAPFLIEVVRVASPKGGDALTSGSLHTITWTVPAVKRQLRKCKVKLVLRDASGANLGSDASNRHFTISP